MADPSRLFDKAGSSRLAHAYPLHPARLSHGLRGHPLFDCDALDRAAHRLGAARVESHHTGGPGDPLRGEQPDRGPDAPKWSMLRFVDQLPEYRALLGAIVDELAPAMAASSGAPHDVRGFVFISTPGTVTPLHFDPEHNILLHLSGRKRFYLLPAGTPWLPEVAHQRLHRDGANMLEWQERWRGDATCFDLSPGDALFVPYKRPHWIEVDDEPAVSLSVTWQCPWTRTQPPLHRPAADLARLGVRLGIAPASLPPWPHVPRARLLAARVADRLRR